MGAPDFSRRPLADKFLYRALVRVNAYKYAKFQLPSSTGVLKFNLGARGLLLPFRTPYAETFVCALGTWQGQTARQISASCSYANMYFPLAYH